MKSNKKIIGLLLYPGFDVKDLAGPYEIFANLETYEIHTISENTHLLKCSSGLSVAADYSFKESLHLDVLFVPGGNCISKLKGNEAYKAFLQKQSYRTKFVAAVSLGALLLADSGILNGYKVTTSTCSLPILFDMGLMAVEARIVIDGNRITGGDRTSGADISLVLAALMELDEKTRIEHDRKRLVDNASW